MFTFTTGTSAFQYSEVMRNQYQHQPVRPDAALTGIGSHFVVDRKDCSLQTVQPTLRKSGMFCASASFHSHE